MLLNADFQKLYLNLKLNNFYFGYFKFYMLYFGFVLVFIKYYYLDLDLLFALFLLLLNHVQIFICLQKQK